MIGSHLQHGVLRPGIVLAIARTAHLQYSPEGHKRPLRCPFHEDRHASAFLDPEKNTFHCSVCTPGTAWTAKRLAEALGVPWPLSEICELHRSHRLPSTAAGTFSPADARSVWGPALARARDDSTVDADAEVYTYLRKRQLELAFEDAAFGIVADGMPLPGAVAHWPRSGHRLVVPLFDSGGNIMNIQAKCVRADKRKTLFPSGSSAKGLVFASRFGQQLLRGSWTGRPVAILGEGLTDSLALGITATVPVLAVPGAQYAPGSIGLWVMGIDLYLTLDEDKAGQNQVHPAADRAYQMGARSVAQIHWPAGCKDACDLLDARGADGLARVLHQHIGDSRHE